MKYGLPPTAGATPTLVEVLASDLDRLDEETFLNDTLIHFYMTWIEAHMPESMHGRCHFFNPFFYSKLTERQTPGSINYEVAHRRS